MGHRAAAGADSPDRDNPILAAGPDPPYYRKAAAMNGGMQMGRDLGLLLPEITVLVTAVLALVAEMLRQARIALILTVAGLLVATGLTVPVVGQKTTVFMGTYRVDMLSEWAKLIILPTVALVVLLAVPEVKGTDREGTVYSLLAFTTLGPLMLSGAGDIMFLVLGVLLSSLGSFALVAYPRNDRATEAAMKYFVYGSVTEAVMIFGLTFWYGASGSTLLNDLSRLTGNSTLPALAGLAGVLTGLGYKAALAPFQFWAPDAYDGGPLAIAAYLSIVPKIGSIFGLAQVARNLPASISGWPLILALLAALSMTYGNLAALTQANIVRLLAYSSIAQSGYFLLGVVALGKSEMALQSLVVFGAAYAAMNLGAFAVTARVGRDLAGFTGLGRSAPWLAAGMVLFLLSLVGVPPLGGFAGKLLLFGAALDSGYSWLAVVAILNSVLSLAVYLRVIVPIYRPGEPLAFKSRETFPVWGTALFFTVFVGLAVQLVLANIV
ncbi:MAG TPA: NADH-quinone oxidoreductase subunit N [Chloroflexia bacterium]|nr:NADH-quinone oxidoreductase subunit N [Chloroflexia bacterium]